MIYVIQSVGGNVVIDFNSLDEAKAFIAAKPYRSRYHIAECELR